MVGINGQCNMYEQEKRTAMNEQIALFFGFRKCTEHPVDGKPQWSYPHNWYLPQGGIPNTGIPDFVALLENQLQQLKKFEFGSPHDYNTTL